MKTDSIAKGVDDAFSHWLWEHEISFPELLEESIKDVFHQWLEDHSAEIISAIAKNGEPKLQTPG